jgi:hypothetical protein
MKKQWKKKEKNFSGQHHFMHPYNVYNDWKELEKLQESSGSFMGIMNAFTLLKQQCYKHARTASQ